MDFEQRLRSHMNEFADRIDLPEGEGAHPVHRRGRGSQRAITAVTAVIVLAMAGVGFLLVSDDGGPTSVAAGEPEDAEQDDEAVERGEGKDGGVAANIPITAVDVSSPDAPSSGRVQFDDGIYYVLSTAPGKADISGDLSEEDLAKVFRQNTFYILDENREWQTTKIEDRFVSDFAVNDGVLYVLSTGTLTADEASFGSSTDNGASWDWNPINSMPNAHQVRLLVNEERTLVFASRWNTVEFNWAIEQAVAAGIDVNGDTLLMLDTNGFSYLPVDTNDRCAVVLAYSAAGLRDFASYIATLDESEQEQLLADYDEMLRYTEEELEGEGCDFDESWRQPGNVLEAPGSVEVTWASIGVDVPEEWDSWMRLYSLDGSSLTEHGVPFTAENPGWATVVGDQLQLTVHQPNEANLEEPGTSTLWTTSDGEDWDSRVLDPSEEEAYYDPSFQPPNVGELRFRIWWDESQEEAYGLAIEEAERAIADGELTEDEAMADIGQLHQSLLQRSTAGGAWETIDPQSLAPDLDLGDRRLSDVRGTALGVMLFFVDPGYDGAAAPGSTVLFTSNGVDWQRFEVDGSSYELYSHGDQTLILSKEWVIQPGEEFGHSQVVLVQPAG